MWGFSWHGHQEEMGEHSGVHGSHSHVSIEPRHERKNDHLTFLFCTCFGRKSCYLEDDLRRQFKHLVPQFCQGFCGFDSMQYILFLC